MVPRTTQCIIAPNMFESKHVHLTDLPRIHNSLNHGVKTFSCHDFESKAWFTFSWSIHLYKLLLVCPTVVVTPESQNWIVQKKPKQLCVDNVWCEGQPHTPTKDEICRQAVWILLIRSLALGQQTHISHSTYWQIGRHSKRRVIIQQRDDPFPPL